MAQQPLVGQGLLSIEGSRSQTLPNGYDSPGRVTKPRRDPYLTTHNGHTSMSPAGFEPTIPASEWPSTHALGCAASGIGNQCKYMSVTTVKWQDRQAKQLLRTAIPPDEIFFPWWRQCGSFFNPLTVTICPETFSNFCVNSVNDM